LDQTLSPDNDWAIDMGTSGMVTWSSTADATLCTTYSGSINVYVAATSGANGAQFHDHCAAATAGTTYDVGGQVEVSTSPADATWQATCSLSFYGSSNCTGSVLSGASADITSIFSPPDGGPGPLTYQWTPFSASAPAPLGAQSLSFGCLVASDGTPAQLWFDMLYATKSPGTY
jgi:hypothetical protein